MSVLEIPVNDNYSLYYAKELTSILPENQIKEYLSKIAKGDAIILHSLESKRGKKVDSFDQFYLYQGGEHYKVKAALLRKGIKLDDLMEDNRLETYSLYPRLYFDPTVDPTVYGASESIKSKLSMFWFIINLILSLAVLYVIVSNFPRNRYYHIHNKRAIIEPYFKGW